MSVGEVLQEIRRLGCPLVLLTGGEPLLQRELPDLARRLIDTGHTVLVETGGSLDIEPLPDETIVILDIKCPGSGEAQRNRWENLAQLRQGDEVKFVLADAADYTFARDVVRSGRIPRGVEILLSPVHGTLDPRDLSRWLLEDRLPVRLNLQVHKYIWGADAKGV